MRSRKRDPLTRALGAKILELRGYSNWTRDDMAVRTGLSVGSIRKHELGQATPTLTALAAYASAFDVAPSDLLRYAELLCSGYAVVGGKWTRV